MAAPRRSTAPGIGSGYLDVSEMDKYRLISNIGKGSFGVISKVQRVADGKEFALKQLDYSKMTDKDRKQILAEVAILESLKHRNIVQLVQKIKDPKNERIYIVMEFCTSGDLGSLIRKAQRTNQPFHEDKIWNIFLQITLALHHCHWPADRPMKQNTARLSAGPPQAPDNGIARYQVLHRDLKPENVFLSDDFVKLGDFGLSKDMGTASFTSTYVGTPLYMPPEILAENRYDTKSDIWSLGCLVYEMCALHSPFHTAQTQPELISMVKSGRLPPLPTQYSPALKNVIKAMLNLNPVRRPSTKDLLDMDEMKLQRKLFTVQNQTSLLLCKRDELKGYEEQLRLKAAALEEREKALSAKEASIMEREAICNKHDEEAKETQRRLNLAAESLRNQWERFREEKEKSRDVLPNLASDVNDRPAKSSMPPLSRPPLEERSTMPLPPTSRFGRTANPTYAETPSKIPLASVASPLPLDSRMAGMSIQPRAITPLRRNNTKSLGNLAAAARADAERDAAWAAAEATPAKQIVGSTRQQRTSIGSPSELAKAVYCEDISMASYASPMSMASPWAPRPRRSSLIPAAPASNAQPSSSGSSSASGSSSGSAGSTESSQDTYKAAIPPTMIPAPTFVYREAATPAKWAMEDPDLPSPFLRRATTAPVPPITEMRQPLGSINPQPVSAPVSTSASAINLGRMVDGSQTQMKKIPRSRSGNLHQHVLKHNAVIAGRTSGEGVAGGHGPMRTKAGPARAGV